MKNSQRIYNNVYTIAYSVTAGTVNNASTPLYFNGYSALRGKTIKAISYDSNIIGNPAYYYLNLKNGKGDQLIYNLPFNALVTDLLVSPYYRMPLFDLYDIDLLNSYWITSFTFPWVSSIEVFRLNFYWE